jgi:hypothetical protein
VNWEIVGYIVGGVFYFVGFCVACSSLDDEGPHIKDFREKYGKDLGLTLGAFHHAAITAGWPAFGGIKFVLGIVRDSIRLFFGKPVVKSPEK